MYRTLSDLDTNCETPCKYGIEWDTDMGRYWEWFNTEAERERELAKYNAECDANDSYPNEPDEDWTDAEADADTLKSAGMGTDEDYNGGYYGNEC
jgi:hypothetical protein